MSEKKPIATPTDEDVRVELQKICNEIDRAITSAGGRSKLKASPLLRTGKPLPHQQGEAGEEKLRRSAGGTQG